MATASVADNLIQDVYSLITVGHVCERKGSSLAIKAAGILKKGELNLCGIFG